MVTVDVLVLKSLVRRLDQVTHDLAHVQANLDAIATTVNLLLVMPAGPAAASER